MGNILVTQSNLQRWGKEFRQTKEMYQLIPYNDQEKKLIEAAIMEKNFKHIVGFLLTISFCASLKRYFPDIPITRNGLFYGASCVTIIMPAMSMVSLYANHEFVERLKVIKINHKIIEED